MLHCFLGPGGGHVLVVGLVVWDTMCLTSWVSPQNYSIMNLVRNSVNLVYGIYLVQQLEKSLWLYHDHDEIMENILWSWRNHGNHTMIMVWNMENVVIILWIMKTMVRNIAAMQSSWHDYDHASPWSWYDHGKIMSWQPYFSNPGQ